jgi:hypothetical protein
MLKLCVWIEVPMQRPSVVDHAFFFRHTGGGGGGGGGGGKGFDLHTNPSEAESVRKLIRQVAGERQHLVAELVSAKPRGPGLQIYQTKCCIRGTPLISIPFFRLSALLWTFIQKYHALGDSIVRLDAKRRQSRQHGEISIRFGYIADRLNYY